VVGCFCCVVIVCEFMVVNICVWCDSVQHDIVWIDTVHFGMVWCCMFKNSTPFQNTTVVFKPSLKHNLRSKHYG